MPLNKAEITMLRKQYPAEHYSIKEENGNLKVSPKKLVIRMFKTQSRKVKSGMVQGETFTEAILFRLKGTKLGPEDFEQCQVTVEKRASDLLTAEAKKCRTRKIIYLQKLVGGL